MADAEALDRIYFLKSRHRATILAHNYQLPEVQDVADFVGDSLQLAQTAAGTDAQVIIFCGVHFMAETAAILNPHKLVVLPDLNAGCPMADMIDAQQLEAEKAKFPEAAVVTYVNSTAAVKAGSDYCCTSSNAVAVAGAVAEDEILFVPDQYLGGWVKKQVPDKRFHLWPGFCPTHAQITPEQVEKARALHPNAKLIVHPECRPEVTDLADAVLSTGGMLKFAAQDPATEIIVGTETGILHRMRKENPDKAFFPVSETTVCPNMKRINAEKILDSLETLEPRISVDPDIAAKALLAIERMLEIG